MWSSGVVTSGHPHSPALALAQALATTMVEHGSDHNLPVSPTLAGSLSPFELQVEAATEVGDANSRQELESGGSQDFSAFLSFDVPVCQTGR